MRARAPATPPDTGASTKPIPASASRASIDWEAATPDVEVSTTWATRRPSTAARAVADLLGDGPVGEAQDHDVGDTTHLGQVGHEPGAVGAPSGADPVVGHQLVTRADQVRGQDGPHVAEADEPDDGHASPASRSARTASRARLAATPAGAPQ